MVKSMGSKRKEHAQEVEFISVYNKRLRKSLIKARNIRKSHAHAHRASHSDAPSTASKLSSSDFLPTPPEVEQDLLIPFNRPGSPGLNSIVDAEMPSWNKGKGKEGAFCY